MGKIYSFNEQQVTEINELYDEVWQFDEPIKNLEILLAKSIVKEEIELIETTKEKISRLKEELECKQHLIMQEEYQTFEIFSDLYYKRKIELDELCLKGTKLEKLGASRKKMMRLKNQIIQVSHFGGTALKIRKKKKSYFNKSLIIHAEAATPRCFQEKVY